MEKRKSEINRERNTCTFRKKNEDKMNKQDKRENAIMQYFNATIQ